VFITEQRIRDVLWIASKPEALDMILGHEDQNLAGLVSKSYKSIILVGVHSILSLPLAHNEKSARWYLGIVLDIEDPS